MDACLPENPKAMDSAGDRDTRAWGQQVWGTSEGILTATSQYCTSKGTMHYVYTAISQDAGALQPTLPLLTHLDQAWLKLIPVQWHSKRVIWQQKKMTWQPKLGGTAFELCSRKFNWKNAKIFISKGKETSVTVGKCKIMINDQDRTFFLFHVADHDKGSRLDTAAPRNWKFWLFTG